MLYSRVELSRDSSNHKNDFSWQAQYLVKMELSLFVAGATFLDILIDSRSVKRCIFPYKMRLQDGTSKVLEAAGAR